MGAHVHAETAVRQILEFDALLAPDVVDGPHGRPPRLGIALLEFMDGALGQSDAKAELALAPSEDRARRPDLGGKGPPLEPDELDEITGAVGIRPARTRTNADDFRTPTFWKTPGGFPPGVFSVINSADQGQKFRCTRNMPCSQP